MQAIYDKNGCLTPELVVRTARRKTHPLHPIVFDRPEKEAAEAYYRERAHELIQSVQVVIRESTGDTPELRVRAFHAVQRESGYTYEPLEKVTADPFTKQLVLQNMEREWRTLYDRYEKFVEFVDMVKRDIAA